MQPERLACGIADAALDGFIATARREGSAYLMLHVDTVLSRIADDMRAMAAPVLDKPFATRLQAAPPAVTQCAPSWETTQPSQLDGGGAFY
jgi:hypothetical protein